MPAIRSGSAGGSAPLVSAAPLAVVVWLSLFGWDGCGLGGGDGNVVQFVGNGQNGGWLGGGVVGALGQGPFQGVDPGPHCVEVAAELGAKLSP
jgi:hypothetical protein